MNMPASNQNPAQRFTAALEEAISALQDEPDLKNLPQIQVAQNLKHIQLSAENETLELSLPIRIGEIVDFLRRTSNKTRHNHQSYYLGTGKEVIYDAGTRCLIFKGEEAPLYLTDKEFGMLDFLIAQAPKAVTRDMLLTQIWEMRPDIETHTVETHIYRLRQKIERNASKPETLVTTEQGYVLNFTPIAEKDA